MHVGLGIDYWPMVYLSVVWGEVTWRPLSNIKRLIGFNDLAVLIHCAATILLVYQS
jgi:hypothetical protein